jgi:hypothetical protein
MDPLELEANFKVVDEENRKKPIIATIAGEATFYFTNVKDAVPALPKIYERVIDMMGPNATHVLVGAEAVRAKKFRPEDRSLVARWAKSAAKRGEYDLSVRSGSIPNSYGAWSFELSVVPPMTADGRKVLEALVMAGIVQADSKGPDASYVYVTVPVGRVVPNPVPFRDLVLGIASALPFRSGHAGLGLAYSSGNPEERRDEQLAAWNKRFHGLDAGSPECSAPFASSHIRGVSWLTMLDEDFVSKVGGREALDTLGPDIAIHALPRGVAIEAGSAPRLGNVDELDDMTPYVNVNKLLKPIRAGEMYPPTDMSQDDAREWLARFDALPARG